MKKVFLYAMLAVFTCVPVLTSCDSNAKFETEVPVNPVMRPITSLTAMDGEDIFEGVIDDNKRTVKLEVEAWTDLSNLTVNLNIPERAKLVSPTSPEGVWDLTEPKEVVVNNLEKDVTYTVTATRKAKFIEAPLVSLVAKAGGETATGEIDHANHTIKVNFGPWVNLTQTALTIEVKPHVKLVDPTESETVCDFSATKTKAIIVNDVQKDVTYTLEVTQTELVLNLVDHKTLKEYKLDNDARGVDPGAGLGVSDVSKLFDGKYMSSSNDYDAVGWTAFACQWNGDIGAAYITVDAGKMMYLGQFSAHRYWNEANCMVTKFDIYGYCQEGEPAKSGSMDGWTLLGSYSYNPDISTNFAEGDIIKINKEQTKQARYYRINAKENWHVTYGDPNDWRAHVYTFTEFRFWEYK